MPYDLEGHEMKSQSIKDMVLYYWIALLLIGVVAAMVVVLVTSNTNHESSINKSYCYISEQIRCTSTNMTYDSASGDFVFALNFTNMIGQQMVVGSNSINVTFGTYTYRGTCFPYHIQKDSNATCTVRVSRTGIQTNSYARDYVSLTYSICAGSVCSDNYTTLGSSYQYSR